MSAISAPAQVDARATRRNANRELALLVVGILAVLVAYTLLGFTQEGVVPPGLGAYGGALAALALAAHLVTRRFAPGADPYLLPVAFTLNGLGLVMVRRLDYANPETALAPAQTIWTVLAVVAFCATLLFVRDHRSLDSFRYIIGIGALVFMLLPLLPGIGVEVNGARIWLRIAGFSIQPGEVAKVGLAVFFASYLAEKRELLSIATNRFGPFMVPPARAFGPVLATWLASLGVLVFQKDLGLSLLLFGMFVLLLYVATARLIYVFGGALLFAAGAFLAWTAFGHVQQRIAIWLDPFADVEGAGFQLVQSLFALGTGGILGTGLGQGRPDFIPFVETDFIFSAFGEELGLLGTTALLLLFFLVAGRGFAIALRCRDDFGKLLAGCLTIIFSLQVFVIVGGVTRLIPLTGLTLPFLSYGGSSLLTNYVLIALLLRISTAEQRAEVVAP